MSKHNDKPRQCFVVLETQRGEHGYIPSLVTEGESGHSPMTEENMTPPRTGTWYWGQTIERATEVCDRINLQRFGISPSTRDRIVGSSMAAQNATEPVRRHSGPFDTVDKRNDATCAGETGPKTKERARAMRKPPFSAASTAAQNTRSFPGACFAEDCEEVAASNSVYCPDHEALRGDS